MKEKNYQANSVSNEQFSHLWEDQFEQHVQTVEENGKKTHIVVDDKPIDLQAILQKIAKK